MKSKLLSFPLLLIATLTFISFFYVNSAFSAEASFKPFPQHTLYTTNSIKPNHVAQAQMDEAVKKKWDDWKKNYLKPAGINKYYVQFNKKGETTSEAHGYGMLLTVIMAGYDLNAQNYFNGLYQYYLEHPSINNKFLMAWKQDKNFKNIEGADSATDGDMDIAYALLLADKQWGRVGAINYFKAATPIINAIMESDVNQKTWTLRLGDWASSEATGTSMRPSDFMLGHLKAFQAATQDLRWKNVVDKTYVVIETLYKTKSVNTGLLPDFIVVDSIGNYIPSKANFLESAYDGDYYYNSCRVPWRLTTDYLISGDSRALDQLNQLNYWIKNASKVPANIQAGYKLDGSFIKNANYSSGAFFAPMGVSAMTNASHQDWLNDIWTYTKEFSQEDYYEDSIKLFAMIVMSGNWWQP